MFKNVKLPIVVLTVMLFSFAVAIISAVAAERIQHWQKVAQAAEAGCVSLTPELMDIIDGKAKP